MARSSLAKKSVIVTRPKRQAGPFARELRAAGARAILVPMIRIAPPSSYSGLDAALRRFSSYDAVVFTSRNAVQAIFSRARRLGLSPLTRPRRLFAVGPKTAEALRERGWGSARVPETFSGAALAFAVGKVRGRHILIPQAKAAREVLARLLRRRGARVSVVEAYRTVPDRSGGVRLKRALKRPVDAVVFASGSAVDQFLSRLGPAACRRLFKRTVAASIGPVTSAALRSHGIEPGVEAKIATTRSLLQGLKKRFNGPRP